MTDDELKAIEDRAAAIMCPGERGEVTTVSFWGTSFFAPFDATTPADAVFHANARADVPRLVAAYRLLKSNAEELQADCRALTEEVGRLKKQRDDLWDVLCNGHAPGCD